MLSGGERVVSGGERMLSEDVLRELLLDVLLELLPLLLLVALFAIASNSVSKSFNMRAVSVAMTSLAIV